MNQATFIGNLTAAATPRTSRDGQEQYITFTVAVNQRMRDGSKRAVYVECSKTGDNKNLLPYLAKGAKVAVSGRVGCHAYVTRDNQAAASLDLRVLDLELVGAKTEQTDGAAAAPAPLTVKPTMTATAAPTAAAVQPSAAAQQFAAQVGGTIVGVGQRQQPQQETTLFAAAPEAEGDLPF